MLKKPVFLVGAERSGSTMCRLMLAHHPEIAWLNEFEYSVDLLTNENQWPNLDEYYTWLGIHRIFLASKLRVNKDLIYPELINDFLAQHQARTGKPIVGATVHRHFDRLLRIWPDARFIHILRDGRDVARSNIGMGWAGNVWTGVERWIDAEELWSNLQQIVPEERRIELTYEALVSMPERELTRVCQFLGLSYSPKMMDYAQRTTYDAPDSRYVAQWKRKLSDRQIQLVESRIAPMLQERGYELSGLPCITMNSGLESRIRLQDWWKRVLLRIQFYGPSLFMADFVSRKLGLSQWQKQVRLRLNAIETANLK